MKYDKSIIEFRCLGCYRAYKTLDHFNHRNSWCRPYLSGPYFAIRQWRLVRRGGKWQMVPKPTPLSQLNKKEVMDILSNDYQYSPSKLNHKVAVLKKKLNKERQNHPNVCR